MSEQEIVVKRCVGKKTNGNRCTRDKKFKKDQAPEEYRCWQHSIKKKEELKLTEKQKAFADEYIISLNATEAAKKAGYSENSAREIGHENLTKPNIQNYIQKRLEEKEAERIATQNEVLEYLTKVMRGEEREVDKFYDKKGREREIRKPPKVKERTKAAELLGKRYAIFVDRQELEINELPTINLVRGEENGS